MEWIEAIKALPKAADKYLKYMGLIFPAKRFITEFSPSASKKPDKKTD